MKNNKFEYPKVAIILAGGKGTRFNGKKDKNLYFLKHNIKALVDNFIQDIIIVVNSHNHQDIKNEVNSIKESLSLTNKLSNEKVQIWYEQQLSKYPGTGGALISAKNRILQLNENFLLILGDNLYNGDLRKTPISGNMAFATYQEKSNNPENIRLAAIKNNRIIEKPHNITSGMFFIGYMCLGIDAFRNNIDLLTPSKRGEFEITELFNMYNYKMFLELNDSNWKDITYNENE